eukprot:2782598-Amphidinium_carterae.1
MESLPLPENSLQDLSTQRRTLVTPSSFGCLDHASGLFCYVLGQSSAVATANVSTIFVASISNDSTV